MACIDVRKEIKSGEACKMASWVCSTSIQAMYEALGNPLRFFTDTKLAPRLQSRARTD
jgi:hypothetical protein